MLQDKEEKVVIPVIIMDMVTKMNDSTLPRHVRDNYHDSLSKISDIITLACNKHKISKPNLPSKHVVRK
jgi:hypothetical protein